jgi:hypothetical protein
MDKNLATFFQIFKTIRTDKKLTPFLANNKFYTHFLSCALTAVAGSCKTEDNANCIDNLIRNFHNPDLTLDDFINYSNCNSNFSKFSDFVTSCTKLNDQQVKDLHDYCVMLALGLKDRYNDLIKREPTLLYKEEPTLYKEEPKFQFPNVVMPPQNGGSRRNRRRSVQRRNNRRNKRKTIQRRWT